MIIYVIMISVICRSVYKAIYDKKNILYIKELSIKCVLLHVPISTDLHAVHC